MDNRNTPKQSQTRILIELKFLFTIIKIILLLCIYFTYDENLFAGLSLKSERLSDQYNLTRGV